MILIKDYAPFSADFKRDEVAQFIYSILVDDVANILRKQKSYNFDNDLIALGEQVVNGPSVYWNLFEDTVIDIVSKRVFYEIPEKFKWALWQNIHYVSTDQIDDDNDEIERLRKICVHEDIAREIFQRLCPIAENAYYEVEEDEN